MSVTASQLKIRLSEILDVPKKQADVILGAFEQVMTEIVKDADNVTIPGFGKLSCVVAPSRKARNPATGESIITKPKINVKFKVATSLKESAPSLKSKTGKRLLAAAEEKQAERDKARKKRERAASKNGNGTGKSKGTSKKLNSTSKNKSGTKSKTSKSSRRV